MDKAFQDTRSKLFKMETAPDKRLCGLRDKDFIGLRLRLNTGRQIGHSPERGLGFTNDEVPDAYHNQSGVDTDTDLQLPAQSFEASYLLRNAQCGLDCATRIVLMYPVVTKVGQDSIAAKLGDLTLQFGDRFAASRLIHLQQLAKIFRVELRREMGRTDKVAK